MYRGVSVAHPLDTIPVCCCPVIVKQTPLGEEEGSCTHTRRQVCMLILLGDPVKDTLVVPFTTRALSSRDNENIEGRMVVDYCVRLYKQSSPACNDLILLGNRQDGEDLE